MGQELNLFSIDVDAEIRKLADRRHMTAWEPLVELIRLAAGFGPESIDVSVTGSRTIIRARGASVPEELFRLTGRVFDRELAPERRHQALSRLEEAFGLGLLSAFAAGPKRVAIAWTRDGASRGLLIRRGESPEPYSPGNPEDFRLEIRGRGCPGNERKIVASRCRFADVPVTLNGTRVSAGRRVEKCMLFASVQSADVRGVAGIPQSGDLTQITRLAHGIVREEVMFPSVRGLVFQAVTEDALADIHAVNAALREVARELYRKLARHYDDLDIAGKKRAETLLFERFENVKDIELLRGVRAFGVFGDAPVDFLAVRESMRGGGLFAIDVDESPEQYDMENRRVFVLDKPQRRFLESVLFAPLAPPPRRARFSSLGERLLSRSRRVARGLNRWFSASGRPIAREDLDPRERAFLDAVQTAIRSGVSLTPDGPDPSRRVCMVEGGSLPWSDGVIADRGASLPIPRSHKLVRAMVRAHSADGRYLQPALTLLTDGRCGPV